MTIFTKSIGDTIREQRYEKGWSQERLAKAMGTKQAAVSRMESGHNMTLRAVENAFGALGGIPLIVFMVK